MEDLGIEPVFREIEPLVDQDVRWESAATPG
jgi:hypothetical protein